VDAIAEISSYAAYADFSERLRKCGFTEDAGEGAPICRWRQKKTILDVMPLDEKILGFSNRWYKPALDSAITELGIELACLRVECPQPALNITEKDESSLAIGPVGNTAINEQISRNTLIDLGIEHPARRSRRPARKDGSWLTGRRECYRLRAV
jgi:hypothetical protein